MVLPLIPLVLIGTGAVTGSGGLYAGARGVWKMTKARRDVEVATNDYNAERERTDQAAQVTNARLQSYGLEQEAALEVVVARMAAFIRRNDRQVSGSLRRLVEGIEVNINECGEATGLDADALRLLISLAGASTTGVGAAAGTTAAVTAFGTASTGASISGLSGVAAQNATMAFLGGGSLASGGGGMALGATALNFVTVGPALLVGGLVLNGQGEKALTRAAQFVADTRIEQASVAGMRAAFSGIESRLAELSAILSALVKRGTAALDALEATEKEDEQGFDAHRHARQFQEAIGLTVAVRDVAATPVVDEDGTLNDATNAITIKYKEYVDDER